MARVTRPSLTKRLVDALKPGDVVWDSDVSGFGVRCQKASKIFVLKYRINGRQRWMSIGRYGSPWTVITARLEAQRLLGELAGGTDVALFRDTARQSPTVEDLCHRFVEDYAVHHKKPSSVATDRNNIANHVVPLIGHMKVREVTRQDIEAFKEDVRTGYAAKTNGNAFRRYRGGNRLTGGKGAANRCLALLSKMFNMAEAWGWRAEFTNPSRHVRKYPETKRQRFLTVDQIQRLDDALSAAEADGTADPNAIAALKMLLYTGARLGEILNLQWRHVRLDDKMIILEDSKTGERVIYLNDLACEVLRRQPILDDNPHVIPGRLPGQPLNNLRKTWNRLRADHGMDDVRIHDLRHSFASTAAANGASLMIIGKLLGHTQAQTTARYAHLVADTVKAAAQDVGQSIARR